MLFKCKPCESYKKKDRKVSIYSGGIQFYLAAGPNFSKFLASRAVFEKFATKKQRIKLFDKTGSYTICVIKLGSFLNV